MTAEVSEYKGHKLIQLKATADAKFPFQFGLSKAKLVLAHINEIASFVKQYDVPAVVADKTPAPKSVAKDFTF